uniref:Uncharacterized protein n=1 Tax=uncultured Thiotrichaceae bacterium TaxID=298394 RepID=A0A6S6UG31_9GAMM|nr:MAG: Unknown protein [uncultured Thiotrichaceae bacterium]
MVRFLFGKRAAFEAYQNQQLTNLSLPVFACLCCFVVNLKAESSKTTEDPKEPLFFRRFCPPPALMKYHDL